MFIFAEDAVEEPAEFRAVGVGYFLEGFYISFLICAQIGETAYRWMGGVGKCVVGESVSGWVSG